MLMLSDSDLHKVYLVMKSFKHGLGSIEEFVIISTNVMTRRYTWDPETKFTKYFTKHGIILKLSYSKLHHKRYCILKKYF